jgi:hypothetical protein
MLKGDYKCPYCGDICNEQGIKTHIRKAHPLYFEEFGYEHLNKYPTGHEKHGEEQEKLIDIMYSVENTAKMDELLIKEDELKTKRIKEQKNIFEKQEEEKDAKKLTKEDVLGLDQTTKTEEQKEETLIVYACGNCEAPVNENMQVCPNCGAPLNWAGVE